MYVHNPLAPAPRKIFGLGQPWVVEFLLILELIKFSGMRIWAHPYMGQATEVSRFQYLGEFAVSLLALAVLVANLDRLPWRKPWLLVATGFIVYAVGSAAIFGKPVLFAVLSALWYWDSFAVAMVSISILGPVRVVAVLEKAAVVAIWLNVAALSVPSTSFMIGEFAGRFRGLMAHRNDLAHLVTLAVFCILCGGASVPLNLRRLTLVLAVLLLAAAGSVQGILLAFGGALAFLLMRYAYLLRHPMVAITAVFLTSLLSLVWWSFGSLDEFLRVFGRDSTFTGRDRIWALALYLLQRMPWHGYGYGEFGSQIISPALLQSFELGTLFGTAHNSYLEAVLAYGWIGGGAFLLLVALVSAKVFSSVFNEINPGSMLAILFLMVCLIGGLTASEKLFMPQLGWLSFMFAIAFANANEKVRL